MLSVSFGGLNDKWSGCPYVPVEARWRTRGPRKSLVFQVGGLPGGGGREEVSRSFDKTTFRNKGGHHLASGGFTGRSTLAGPSEDTGFAGSCPSLRHSGAWGSNPIRPD